MLAEMLIRALIQVFTVVLRGRACVTRRAAALVSTGQVHALGQSTAGRCTAVASRAFVHVTTHVACVVVLVSERMEIWSVYS